MNNYDDIINTEWPRPTLRPRMLLKQRAKIFLPYSALTGYEESLEETRQMAEKRMEEKAGKEQFDDINQFNDMDFEPVAEE